MDIVVYRVTQYDLSSNMSWFSVLSVMSHGWENVPIQAREINGKVLTNVCNLDDNERMKMGGTVYNKHEVCTFPGDNLVCVLDRGPG